MISNSAVLIGQAAERAAEPLGAPGAIGLLIVGALLLAGGIIGLIRNR